MPVDPRVQRALEALPTRDESGMTVPERRAVRMEPPPAEMLEELMKLIVEPVMSETDVSVNDIPVRIYRPHDGRLPALIWMHGGGWWMGDLDTNDGACRWRARDAECVVVAVGYRLAPEHPFPAALDDSWAVTRWVFDNAAHLNIDPHRVAVSGSSAGANLAAAVTQLARVDPTVGFVGQILDIPIVDLTLETSQAATTFAGLGLSPADLKECVELYLASADPSDQRASPLLSELSDLPPARINVCEFDPARPDGEAYAAKLTEAGVEATLKCWRGMVHGTMDMLGVVPDVAADYQAETVEFLRRIFQA